MKKLLLSCLLFIAINSTLHAQVYSNKEVGKKNAEVIDSLKKSEYPYALPIWGAKATKAGFHLPYSAGLSMQYIWQKSDLVIDNLQVGFGHRPMLDLDEIVRFKNATSQAQGINFRPDVWVFPFLNVYGILAKSSPSTTIGAEIWLPNLDTALINLNTKANFQATSFGFGFTPTIGVAGGFMALDMNFTWNDIAELDKPAFAFIFGPRFGKTFKLKKPERAITVWVGGFRLKLNSGTTGSLNFDDLFGDIDTSGLQAKVDNGIQAVGDKQIAVDSWWSGLSDTQQQNPVNKAKYEAANSALEKAGTLLNSMDEALKDDQPASVQYSLDKRPKDMWNFIVGSQYQFNKHWMLRAEVGMFGSRQQIIGGLQYRFGL